MPKILLGLVLLLGLSACSKTTFEMADGSLVDLKDLQGQWVFINYWATWCKPCIEEIPELNDFNQRDKVSVLGYNFDRLQGADLSQAAKTLKIDFSLLKHDPAALFEQDRPSALPATMLINPDGMFVKWLMGPQTQETLAAQMK